MKPYSEYSAEELAMEHLFIRWVRNPNDPEIGMFWDGWVAKYPHMVPTVATAKVLVINASEINPDTMSGEEVNSLWNRIRSTIETFPEIQRLDSNVRNIAGKLFYLRWSIGILSTIAIILIFFFVKAGQSSSMGELEVTGVDSSLHITKPVSIDSTKNVLSR